MNGQTCVLVCVTAQKDCARLIRRGREIAGEKGTGLKVNVLYEENVPAAIARYAGECGADTLVLGPDRSGNAGRVRLLLGDGAEIVNA